MKKVWLALTAVLLIGLTACAGPPAPLGPQQLAARTVAALEKVRSFTLDSDVVNTSQVLSGSASNVTTTYEWKGTRNIDVTDRTMSLSMNITGGGNWTVARYVTGGWDYANAQSPSITNTNITDFWVKNGETDRMWTADAQLSYYIELLRSASQMVLSGSYTIRGTDCYILSLTPSAQAVVDWAIGQEQQGIGPSLDSVHDGGVPVVRADAYRTGSVLFWIDKATFLPLEVRVDTEFTGDVGGGPVTVTPYTPTTSPVDSAFDGQMAFWNYNQPVKFVLPPQAAAAPSH